MGTQLEMSILRYMITGCEAGLGWIRRKLGVWIQYREYGWISLGKWDWDLSKKVIMLEGSGGGTWQLGLLPDGADLDTGADEHEIEHEVRVWTDGCTA
jgi:hypothetical protein